jgi:hypothetical protein
MRQMVGLIQRQGIFYFRRTVPAPLRGIMPSVIKAAEFGIFDDSATVTLRDGRAGREFWLSLKTRDPNQARSRARKLDEEADRLFELAERRMAVNAKPKISTLADEDVASLVTTFRHRKLADDESRRRGSKPLSREQFETLGAALAVREAELRDANARGDCAPAHFDLTAMMTVLDAGLNIELDSPADRHVYLSFIEAELDVLDIIKQRHSGFTRPTPPTTGEAFRLPSTQRAHVRSNGSSTRPLMPLNEIIDGWAIERNPQPKTIDSFRSKLDWWEKFLSNRAVTIHTATRTDASDWKLHLLKSRSPATVVADLNAAKAIYSWGYDNAKISSNPFSGLKPPKDGNEGESTKRGYTDLEAYQILTEARKFKSYRRWAPWIAHYTGARISEVCQLESADISQVDGIYFFRMQTESDDEAGLSKRTSAGKKQIRSLKTSGSKRLIPIHEHLIKEGFIEFVKQCTSKDLLETRPRIATGSAAVMALEISAAGFGRN